MRMVKACKEGKVRAIGLSNFNEEQVRKVLAVCEVRPVVLQTELHPYLQEAGLRKFLAAERIAVQGWYPLGHGDSALLQEPVFVELGKKYGKSSAQVILRWHVQSGFVTIPGSKNPAHIRDNSDLFDFALTDEETGRVAALDKGARYFTCTPELLEKFAVFVPDVDGQK